jgi:hypothetical protein
MLANKDERTLFAFAQAWQVFSLISIKLLSPPLLFLEHIPNFYSGSQSETDFIIPDG